MLFGIPLYVAREIDPDVSLILDDPGIVSGTDHVNIAGPYLLLGTVSHDDLHPSRNYVARVL
jgi:hypothetical protein